MRIGKRFAWPWRKKTLNLAPSGNRWTCNQSFRLKGSRRKAGNAKEKYEAKGIAIVKGVRQGWVGGEVSEHLFETGLCLPSGTQMTEEDFSRVVNVIKNCYQP